MNNSHDDLRQEIALFRYGVIADLVHLPVGAPGTGALMRAKAELTYTIPGTDRTRVAANTMRGWVKLYRRGGFDALYPKPRTDRGQPRRLTPEVAERLVALKTGNPSRFGAGDHQDGARGRHRGSARPVHRAPASRPRGAVRREAAERRRRPAPLRLPRGGRAVDERRHARAQGPRRPDPGARPT